MLHRVSLLDELRKGGYEASLITTFNAYLPFYEEVVLRRLVNAGVRHNVVMMDDDQYAHSLATHPPKLAGRSYTLLPVTVGGAFHPKLVFLAGKKKGLILVGSHNLTLAGFGFNRELTNLVRIDHENDAEGIALARDAWAEVDYWLEHFTAEVPAHVRRMVARVRDFAPWISGAGERSGDIQLLVGPPGVPLWDQLENLMEAKVTSVSVAGAFFDQDMQFIKRLDQDLKPAKLILAVDPNTVRLPPKARTISNISLVRADGLGAENDQEAETSRYLHAKAILIEQQEGGAIFASGSANPSAPAWLPSAASGNVELMLAYRGARARTTADNLGFNLIADMPALNEDDWRGIESNEQQQAEPAPLGYRSGVAVVEEGHIALDKSLLAGADRLSFVLCMADGIEIARSDHCRIERELAFITFAETDLARANALHVLASSVLRLKLLLHHAREIEEQARSGMQRRFKEALPSLETDTPNIELLIQCIDKIVFSEARERLESGPRKSGARDEVSVEEQEAPESLAIDVEDMKHRKSKKRLSHSGDFAYLLDALIYHLRLQHDKSVEEVDRFGRSEEEQVGADDDQDDNQDAAREREELLGVCHRRVSTVIGRMAKQLEAYASGKQALDEVLVRLLAVLAVLRELRKCDGRVAWVEKGETTVPKKQRLYLLEEIMFSLFEGEKSLLHLEALGEEFRDSDDVARLKGLVLWLAWDCSLTLDLQKRLDEDRDDRNERFKRNAMVLALAQMIRSDDVVIDEARQSIGTLTTSEMNWLKAIQSIGQRCEAIRDNRFTLHPAAEAQPGDLAVHRELNNWDLRVVAQYGSNQLSLIKLSRKDEFLKYRSQHLAVARLT